MCFAPKSEQMGADKSEKIVAPKSEIMFGEMDYQSHQKVFGLGSLTYFKPIQYMIEPGKNGTTFK